jgi:signal transduction histidine kinase
MPNGGTLNVSTHLQSGNNGKVPAVVVDFADDGSGMEPEILAHIFDPLYTTKAPGQGTGLGLVVVSQVVREHGGQVEVESKPGGGTRFRLTFPTWNAAAEVITEGGSASSTPRQGGSSLSSPDSTALSSVLPDNGVSTL